MTSFRWMILFAALAVVQVVTAVTTPDRRWTVLALLIAAACIATSLHAAGEWLTDRQARGRR